MSERPWVVVRDSRGRGWGGEIRRARIFEALAARTGATVVDDWPSLQRHVRGRRWQVWRRLGPRPFVAASETVTPKWAERLPRLADAVAVAIYDDPAVQARALGMPLAPEREEQLALRRRLNETGFRWHVVPTASFAELVGLDADRVVVGGNGTMASLVRPGPWPERKAVGFVSGAAPGRGIERLIEAIRLVRAEVPDTALRLWLLATSEAGTAYVEGLREATAADHWLTIAPAPYERLGETLSSATVLAIPHPANDYMDVALPVKLFDSMAAGRPLVVTPRRETARIVERLGVGLVAEDDRAESIAASLLRLLADETTARAMGDRARRAAEEEFDWPIVGGRIADEILRRERDRGES
jgi:glycosyltransferase involved in cell wall biosynthesis